MKLSSYVERTKSALSSLDLDRTIHTAERAAAGTGVVLSVLEIARIVRDSRTGGKDPESTLTAVARVGAAVGTVATIANGIQRVTRGIEDTRRPYIRTETPSLVPSDDTVATETAL